MNEFLFIVGVAGVTFVCMATWVGGKELLTRWMHNDWCRHEWGAWKDHENVCAQARWCSKCNMMEKRVP